MKGRNSRPAMESSTTEKAEVVENVGVSRGRQGLAEEEIGGRMVGWGFQQRKGEEIRLEFWFRIRYLYMRC